MTKAKEVQPDQQVGTDMDTEGAPLWRAQVALANTVTKLPGTEGDLRAAIDYVGSPEGWKPGDGLIDPATLPPTVPYPYVEPPPEADGETSTRRSKS